MSTPNFKVDNANKHYAVLMNREITDPEGETTVEVPDELEMEDLLGEIKNQMNEKFKDSDVEVDNLSDSLDDRQFAFSLVSLSKVFAEDFELTISFRLTLNEGYYEGATLDYNVDLEETAVSGHEFENLPDYSKSDIKEVLKEWIEDWQENLDEDVESPESPDIGEMIQWINKSYGFIEQGVEDVYENICEVPLVRVGIFSNGEAVYERANTLRGEVNKK